MMEIYLINFDIATFSTLVTSQFEKKKNIMKH